MSKALPKYYEVLEELKGISIEEITEAFSKRILDSLPEVFSQKHLFEGL